MMTKEERSVQVTITVAAQRTGLKVRMVERCIQRGLVSETLSEEDLAALRRVRRISELGVNLPGVEIILHMRRQIEALRTELAELEAAMEAGGTPRAPAEWRLTRAERHKPPTSLDQNPKPEQVETPEWIIKQEDEAQ